MNNNDNNTLDIMTFIVNLGMARKIIKHGREHGMLGATVFLGKGTAHTSKLLDFLDLTDSSKEIIFVLIDDNSSKLLIKELNDKFKFYKPNHGIVFTMPVSQIIGSSLFENYKESRGVKKPMHRSIFTIVDKGYAEDVIDAACAAGARGGTIINARGSGIHETSKIFNMEIAPEKEIVLILAETERSKAIITSIREKLNIDEAGKGVIFIQDVSEVYGLRTEPMRDK